LAADPVARAKLAVEPERKMAQQAVAQQPVAQQPGAAQPTAPQPVATASPQKSHPFEPDEEAAIRNANTYAGETETVQDEPAQQLAKQLAPRPSGIEDVTTAKPMVAKPSAAKPAPSAPPPAAKPAAAPPVAKGFVASPAPPAAKPKAPAGHQKAKKQEEDEYDFGI
jgi:hypothetical protein